MAWPAKRSSKKPISSESDASRPVFSYYATGSQGQPAGRRSSAAKLMYIIRHLPSFIAGAAILIALIYSLILSTNPKLVRLSPSGHAKLLRSQSEYDEVAHQLLSSSIFNRTKVTINVNGFETAMKRRFPELANVALIIPITGQQPVVELEAASPALVVQTDQGRAYLIDSQGRAVEFNSSTGAFRSLNLPLVVDQSGLTVALGQGLLSASDVSFINTVVLELKAKNIAIESMTLPAIASELHVKIAGQPYYVKFDLQGDPRTQVGTFLAVKQRLDSDHIIASEYIDVRVEEKAYYK